VERVESNILRTFPATRAIAAETTQSSRRFGPFLTRRGMAARRVGPRVGVDSSDENGRTKLDIIVAYRQTKDAHPLMIGRFWAGRDG